MTHRCWPGGFLKSALASALLLLSSGLLRAAPSPAPGVSLTPVSHAFPWEAVGSVSPPLTFTLSNTTGAAVSISGISISDPQFTQTNTCGAQLAASSSCTISVVFAPQKDGIQSATLSISDSATESPQTVSMTGTGSRTATVSPLWYAFPAQAIGSSSSPQSFTLTNNEAEAVSISAISFSNPQFAETDTCGGSLAAGASCAIAVTFSPTNFGAQSATLTINDTAATGPQAVSLSGTGGTALLAPASVNFSSQAVGSSATPATILLTNPNSIPLPISAIETSNPHFIPTTTCGANLGVGASCIVWITFAPSLMGPQSATLEVRESSGNLQQTASLSGTGTGNVTLAPAAYTFPNVGVGSKSAPALFFLSNSQDQAVSISGVSTSNAQFVEDTTCGASLGPGASCVIAVRFEPQWGGEQSTTLSIADSAFAAPQQVNLSGVAVSALGATPLSLAFASQIIGRPSGPQIISVVNQQSSPVNITSINSSLTQFPITTNCIPAGSSAGVLNPGAGCSISVSYLPSAAETDSGVISITDDASGGPETILTTGTGIVEDTAPSALIAPQSPCVFPSGTQQFQANVTNLSNTTMDWYVDGIENGSSQTGTISSQGLYTAPSSAGTHTIEGISEADQSLTVSTSIKVTTSPTWAVFPATATVLASTQQSFQLRLCEVPTSAGAWYVDKIAGGNATVGTISANGTYTAPGTPGSHTISLVSTSPKGTAAATATVFSGVDVDFGARASTAYPIRSGFLGASHVDWLHNSADTALLAASGISTSRTYADLSEIYAGQAPNWSALDASIATLQANGIHALLVVTYTPVWLQPNPNPCGWDYPDVSPTDFGIWADLAASVVAHMDSAFPGEVTDYEIWNEPDGGGLCGSSALEDYLQLYADGATAMKVQAAADGVSIRIGGPASAGANSTWNTALLSNPATYPLVDFISYHDYIGGGPNLDAAWNTYNGSLSLDQLTQETTPSAYLDARAVVAAGDQPDAANTPIYITEYNTNWKEAQDCCRNDPVYSPVWNGLYIADLLDVAYSAQQPPPAQLIYYAATSYPYFCLIGTWDVNMDCQYSIGSSPVPYPQYYAYQLIASPQYLDINDGGYMAAQVTPLPVESGLAVTAFYTARQDSILIVNPTATNYTQVPVNIANPGFTAPAAQLYQVVGGNSISTSSVSLTPSGAGVSATIATPPYSVVGISITGP
jgi:hypothetical protein